MKRMGDRIEAKRLALGLTPFELSLKARIPEQNIRLWEKGRTPKDPSSIAAIAKALCTTTDYLIAGEGEQ